MTKQLLIYEEVVPVSKERHLNWSVSLGKNYNFARSVNAVPLMAVEFPKAAAEYSIVFTGNPEDDEIIMPVVILGFRNEQNLYLNEEGQWKAKYIPAFIRRYPFVFSNSNEGKIWTLCIDEEFQGCNQEGRGERFFDSQGEQTQYLNNVLQFLKDYQVQFERTRIFCHKLKELELLKPMQAIFTLKTGEQSLLGGFMAIDREKFKELTGEQLADLMRRDELELMFLHLQSMQNLNSMVEKIVLSQKI